MIAFITGSRGFCGQHLTRLLTGYGVEVHSVGPFDASGSRHVRLADLGDTEALQGALRRLRPDFFFHLAGVGAAADASTATAVNVGYAATVLTALECAESACRLLLVGSAAEYGTVDATDLPLRESHVGRPAGIYGRTKLEQTRLGLAAAARGLAVTVARPFNIIGPGMPEHVALGSFVAQLRRMRESGENTLRFGNLTSIRDFIDVNDAMGAYWQLIQSERTRGEIVNVCSGVPVVMQALVDQLRALAAPHVRTEVDPARVRASEVPVSYGSTELLDARVNLPRTTLRESLVKIVRSDLGAI